VLPSLDEVDAISALGDPVLRNVRITLAYHELCAALAALTGAAANWCTFATWASKQAGQTIRREDLVRKVEDELGDSEALRSAVSRIGDFLQSVGRSADRSRIVAAIREVFSPAEAIERSSEAVARGNKKVFDEIGREFSRFLAMLRARAGDDASPCHGFGDTLRPGPPPDGQDLLKAAFAGYDRALSTADAKAKAELILLANVRIGLHEQTRLQPEIALALNAPIADPAELKVRVLQRLVPEGGRLLSLRARFAHRPGWTSPLDEACRRLTDQLRRLVRQVMTEHLMTLALPEGALRLGSDLSGSAPENLRSLANEELLDLLRTIDPTPDSLRESGAVDWAVLGERMHFVADLFRTRQEQKTLFDAPFTPEQAQAIKQGRMPEGRL
jgi:hypothetical protein